MTMQSSNPNQAPPRFKRRQVLRLCGSLALGGAALGCYAWRIEPIWPEVVERPLAINGLPASLQGARLLQLSDLHAGSRVPQAYLERALNLANRLEPDLTVITGDFVHYRTEHDLDTALAVMSVVRPAKLGIWAVLGNHDYGPGWSDTHLADTLTAGLRELGIGVLRNELAFIANLQLVGIDDYWSPCFAPELVVPRVDWQAPALTLCHNPDAVDTRRMAACRGWILAGHTHGGQVRLPGMQPPIVPSQNPRYTLGEIDLGGGRWLYINRGLGYGVRLRLNVRPELTLFHLQRA